MSAHAYMLIAAPVPERLTMARELAAGFICGEPSVKPGGRGCLRCAPCGKVLRGTHPDVITVSRQTDDKGSIKREIYVGQIRALTADTGVMPNEARAKVYIIDGAGFMNEPAQNALLKALEEPPEFVRFILCATGEDELLPTVVSRCSRISAHLDEAEPELTRAREVLQVSANGGGREVLELYAGLEKLGGEEFTALLDGVVYLLTECLCGRAAEFSLTKSRAMSLIKLYESAREKTRVNVSAKLLLGELCARTIELGR